jgi:hypothetical protein
MSARDDGQKGRWSSDPLALPNVRGHVLDPEPRVTPAPDDPEEAGLWLRSQPRPWPVDLFSGAGGLGLGLKRAGLSVVAAADSDSAALKTYRANLGALTFEGDLADPSTFLAVLACARDSQSRRRGRRSALPAVPAPVVRRSKSHRQRQARSDRSPRRAVEKPHRDCVDAAPQR